MINEPLMRQALANAQKHFKRLKKELNIMEAELDDSKHRGSAVSSNEPNLLEIEIKVENYLKNMGEKFKIKKEEKNE